MKTEIISISLPSPEHEHLLTIAEREAARTGGKPNKSAAVSKLIVDDKRRNGRKRRSGKAMSRP